MNKTTFKQQLLSFAIITLGAATVGAVSGICSLIFKKCPLGLRLIPTVALSHILGSVVVKTFGLAAWYDMPIPELMLWRLLNSTIVGVLEYTLLFIILKNKTVSGQIKSILED